VRELQDGPDEPEDRGRAGRGADAGGGGDAGAIRARVEPRSRGEYTAELYRQLAAGLAGSSMRPGDGPRGTESANAQPEVARRLEVVRRQEVLRRFDAGRAGLQEFGAAEAQAYIEAHRVGRPWLDAVRDRPPEVRRVFAALDQGGGHAHIRHDGWVTEEMNRRRVAYLEDPAQVDPIKRSAGIDGMAPGSRLHKCRETSSQITDPDAFAVAFARGIEHPAVRTALETTYTAGQVPRPVSLPILDLLGPVGHRCCNGWRLQPVEGSMNTARENRAAWVDARKHGRDAELPEPEVRKVRTFAGGTIVFAFGPTCARDGYEVVTMYPRPRPDT
jgi:hypothetical protein